MQKAASTPIGDQLRLWRERRQLSQLELSLRADSSARHLSFVETGRAQPGRDLVLRLAEELEIPLRERNRLLMAGGHAPVFQQRAFDDPSFDAVRGIITLALETHKPFPAYVIDRHWTVVLSNAAVPELYEGVAEDLVRQPINAVRLMLHPQGLAPRILNLAAWHTHLTAQLHRQFVMTSDPVLGTLLDEVSTFGLDSRAEATHKAAEGVAIPLEIMTRLGRLSFLSATTIFGTPLDITLEDIALEMLYPADSFTRETIRRAAADRG